MRSLTPARAREQESIVPALLLSLRLAWNLGYIIAIPVVLFGFGGAYLDKHFGTSPFLVLSGFTLAAVLSAIGVYRKVKEIFKATVLPPSAPHGRN
ncbi:hypothetical protein COU79_00810 [Candidatus Peregrinibacteria bacterium CG10_big_fil_rev_8_21_14_0_10_54_7]|nr:MAG: hypothetical protein COU79_00810 [Candidatus Peregrinibacteria bacterium CG10_big_fil_rev_8_21_14_0_10_54_7]